MSIHYFYLSVIILETLLIVHLLDSYKREKNSVRLLCKMLFSDETLEKVREILK